MWEDQKEAKVAGVILSPTAIEEFSFIPLSKDLKKGYYCSFLHPQNRSQVLARVYRGKALNPKMNPDSYGVLLAKLGIELGKEIEVIALEAETLGYLNEDNEFCYPDFPSSPGSEVYEVGTKSIKKFFKNREGTQISIGIDPYSQLHLEIGLDELTKGHMAICGMTRSGKTTFVLSLIKKALSEGCCFLVFDRTGEYQRALEEVNGKFLEIIDPFYFQGLKQMTPSQVASFLKIGQDRKAEEVLINVICEAIESEDTSILNSPINLFEKCKENIATQRERISREVERLIKQRSELIKKLSQKPLESKNIISFLKPGKVVIINLSQEREITAQQIIVASILGDLFTFVTKTKGEEVTCLVVIEEAQFYAPERTVFSVGDPLGTKSLETLTSCLSQLGGYNIGFIIITQRPAYVSKSILSQCNTFLTFHMRSHADHEQIAGVTGLPSYRISSLLSNLPDHVGYLIGMASPFEFPTFITIQDRLYTKKATLTPSQVLNKMKGKYYLK